VIGYFVLTAAYGPLAERNLPLAGNERNFVAHILSALQKRGSGVEEVMNPAAVILSTGSTTF